MLSRAVSAFHVAGDMELNAMLASVDGLHVSRSISVFSWHGLSQAADNRAIGTGAKGRPFQGSSIEFFTQKTPLYFNRASPPLIKGTN